MKNNFKKIIIVVLSLVTFFIGSNVLADNTSSNCTISSFNASPTSINLGSSSTLSWVVNNCNLLTISNTNYIAPNSGSQPVSPTVTTTYVLTAIGENGVSASLSTTVFVLQPSCSISSFTASPSYINNSGGSSTLNWNTNNCTSVNISNLNYNVPSSGSQVIYPTYTTTYTLTAYGVNGIEQTQSVTVTVNNNQYNNCTISYFTASPSYINNSGGSSTLNWNTNNCTSVNISNLNYNVPSSGSQVIYPTSTTTYTLTAYGTNGTQQNQSITVTVQAIQNNCIISNFTASPTSINYGGSSTLSWGTNNCTSVNITNIGSVNNYGSQIVYPTNTINYIISAYGLNGGAAVTQTIQVYVNNYVPPVTPTNNICAITSVATNITQNSVTLNGLITDGNLYGASTYFEYGATVDLGSQTNSRLIKGDTSFSQTLTGLSSNTIYFYRLVSNCGNNGISKGSIEIFQTAGSQKTTTIIKQGTTIIGTESPIMLKIENRFQLFKIDDSVDYTITYKNISTKTLTRPILQVILPKGVVFLNSSRGTYSNDTHTLTVSLEDLIPNVEGVVYIQGRVEAINSGNAQIVTTALLVYTSKNGAQENAIAYVLNNPIITSSIFGIGAAALFGSIFGIGIIGWMILLILILIAILLFRKLYNKQN